MRRFPLYVILSLTLTGGLVFSYYTAKAQSVAQTYSSNTPLQSGIIVQPVPNQKTFVEPALASNPNAMFGVVVNPQDAGISLSGGNGAQTLVATSGDYSVLVDNQDGPINSGDYITISSINGIGRKAVKSDSIVLGQALQSFNATTDTINTVPLNQSNGAVTTLKIGRIEVHVGIGQNPIANNSLLLPRFLQQIATKVANKNVSDSQIYLSLFVLLLTAIISGSLLYSGVKSSIISIGRNPLSRKSIYTSLVQVSLTGLIVFIIGLIAVYLLLKV